MPKTPMCGMNADREHCRRREPTSGPADRHLSLSRSVAGRAAQGRNVSLPQYGHHEEYGMNTRRVQRGRRPTMTEMQPAQWPARCASSWALWLRSVVQRNGRRRLVRRQGSI